MPQMNYEPSRRYNDLSELAEGGLYPCFLLEVTEDAVPDDWPMKEKSDVMWRWYFAIFGGLAQVDQAPPELQSVISSTTFSSGGKYRPSKSYLFLKALLNRDIAKGESIDPNTLVPLAAMARVTRKNSKAEPVEFAIVKELEPWPDGPAALATIKASLAEWWAKRKEGGATAPLPADTPATPPAPPATQAQATPPPAASQAPQTAPPAATPPAPAPAPRRAAW